jgi:hypothetical protein
MTEPSTPRTVSMIERMEPMIWLTERLTELIAQQAVAFESGRPQDAAPNIEETAKLANIYRREAAQFRQARDELLGAPVALRRRLVQATEAFDAVMARQERALHAAKTVTEGLVHAIANEVANQRSANAGYGPKGTRSIGSAASAIALNQRA